MDQRRTVDRADHWHRDRHQVFQQRHPFGMDARPHGGKARLVRAFLRVHSGDETAAGAGQDDHAIGAIARDIGKGLPQFGVQAAGGGAPQRLAAAAKRGGEANMDEIASSVIRIDWQIGYWVALAALAVAAALAFLAIRDPDTR